MSHLTDDVYQGALPAMLPYLVADRHLSLAAAGMLVFAANLTSSVGQPFYGHLADRGRAWWLCPVGLAVAGIGIGLAGVVHGYWWIFAAVAFSGIGVDAFHPAASRAAHQAARGVRAASRFAWFSLGGNAGFALGPLVALPVLAYGGLDAMPFLAVPALLAAAALARRLRPAPDAHAALERRPSADRWGPFSLVTAAVLARSVAFFGISTYLPLWWVQHLHHSKAAADAALTAFMCAGVFGTLLGGRLADRYGGRAVAAIGLGSATPLMLVYLALATRPAAFLLLIPAGVALYVPFSIMVNLGQHYLPNRIGTASGVTLGLAASAGGLAAPLLGAMASHTGLTAVLILASAIPALAALAPGLLPSE